MKQIILVTVAFVFCFSLDAQFVHQTFKDTRVINTHSVETLPKRKLDVRISHRFGDIGGDLGGWSTFYGLENAADILIGVDYGATDNLTLGFYRTKGSGPLTQLLNGVAKYRLIQQKENSTPLSITAVAVTSLSTREKTDDPEVITSFTSFSHRFVHNFQLILARKFSDRFSLQILPGYTHRNVVPNFDENGIVSLGFATRIQLTKVFGIIADLTLPFSDLRTTENGYYAPFGIGLEIETGGHVFQINFTNATGIMETDYIPYTRSKWGDGEFRLGFTVSRLFNL